MGNTVLDSTRLDSTINEHVKFKPRKECGNTLMSSDSCPYLVGITYVQLLICVTTFY